MPPAITLRAAEFLDSPSCGPLPQQTRTLVREKAAAVKAAQEAAQRQEGSHNQSSEAATVDREGGEAA